MYKIRQLVGIRLWILVLCSFILAVLTGLKSYGQCDYNEGASPTFGISGNNASAEYSTVVVATDESGVIRYISTTSSKQLQNLVAGEYKVHSFNYKGAAPASLTIGSNISQMLTESACVALSEPLEISVCKCTDTYPATGTLSLSLTSTGQNSSVGYSQRYLLLGADGKIKSISNTAVVEISEQNSYAIYSINYKTDGGVSGLSIGNALTALTGDCFDLSNPIEVNVCPAVVLPVTLVSFEAIRVEQQVVLNWITSTESNSDRFEVQRSRDGKTWSKLSQVDAKGESKGLSRYAYTDQQPFSGENLYRLKMIDRDESFAYSRLSGVTFELVFETNMYPNPAGDILNIRVSNWEKVKSVIIDNTKGITVHRSGALTTETIDLKNLPEGMYIVRIFHIDGSVHTHKLIHIK
jgi:hypothetical protein